MKNKAVFKIILFSIILTSCMSVRYPVTPTNVPNTITPEVFPAWLTSWLKNAACEPPCWENIVPGITTKKEATLTLSKLQDITDLKEVEVIPYGKGLHWNRGSIFFDNNNVVKQIDILIVYSKISVDRLITRYGSPKYVVFYGQETIGMDVGLVYPESGLVLGLYSADAERAGDLFNLRITPEQEVYNVSFYAPGLEHYYSTAWQPVKKYEWKGYTVYP